jgi:hypothetical protein
MRHNIQRCALDPIAPARYDRRQNGIPGGTIMTMTRRWGAPILWMAICVLAAPGTARAAVFDGWAYRTKIAFAGYNKPESLTNFPALVTLSTNIAGFHYADFNSPGDGADLRFADAGETVPLNYEIERWDTNSPPIPTAVPGCQLWLKADDGAQTNASGVVTNWLDMSGMGRNTASVGSPLLAANAVNGKPAVRFNGSGQYFNSVTLNSANNSFHVFVVLKAGARSAYHNVFEKSSADPMLWADSGNKYEMNGGGGAGKKITSVAGVGGWDIVHACMNNGATVLYVNGIAQGSGTETGAASASYTLFNRGNGQTFTGDVAEVVCYSNSLTEAQQQQIGAYLAGKYGLAGTAYATGRSYVWVQVPALSGTNDYVYAYWGRATNAAPCTTNGATWSNGYAGVWHLNNPTNPVDSSANNRHGTNAGVTAAAGRIGGGGYFNGSARIVATNNIGISGSAARTLSCWANIIATPDPGGLLGWGTTEGNGRLSYITPSTAGGYAFSFWGYTQDRSSGVLSRDSAWHLITATYDGANVSVCVDGVLRVSGANALNTDNTPVYMGCPGSRSSYITGCLDELSIATVARSTNWIWACWSNQVAGSAFLAYGAVGPNATGLTVRANAASGLATNGATLNGAVTRTGAASNAEVYVVWDFSDKGTNALTDWTYGGSLGTNWTSGASFSTNVTGLISGSNYAYRCFATNTAGESAWSDFAVFFAVPYLLRIQGLPANYSATQPLGYGDTLVTPGTTLTNTVTSPTNAGATVRRTCVGWNVNLLSNGTPAGGGAGTQAIVQVTNHLALTWNWTNEWYLTVTNTAGGTNGVGQGWYTNATPVSVTAFATGAYHFIGWSGDVPAGSATNNPIAMTMDQARAICSQFSTSSSNFTLVIAGSPGNYGLPQPLNYGAYTTNILDGSWITNSVSTPTNATSTLRRTCVGWTLAYTNGTYLTGGGGTQAVFQLDASKMLTWQWTNEYYLSVGANVGGTATTNLSGWYTNGLQQSISASPTGSFSFLQWMGNVPAGSETNNPLTLTMDQPRSVVPVFVDNAVNETKLWSGTNYWYVGTNWAPAGVPGPEDDVIVRAGTVVLPGPTTIKSLIVSNAATLVFSNWNSRLTVAGSATVKSNGTIALPPAFTDVQTPNNVYFSCSNFTLDAGGTINADFKGYLGVGGNVSYGPGSPGAVDRGGASHGGRGSTRIAVYGSTNAPILPGSSGNGQYGPPGGSGGGAVRIEASGCVLVNGVISANAGSLTADSNVGGGSGGSVFITCATFASTGGVIRANGGSGDVGVGGGGRIAIVCTDPAAQRLLPKPTAGVSVQKGTGRNSGAAEMGTLYLSDNSLLPESASGLVGRISGISPALSFNFLAWTNSVVLFPPDWGPVTLTVTNDFTMNGSTIDSETNGLLRTTPIPLVTVGGNLTMANSSLYLQALPTNGTTVLTGGVMQVAGVALLGSNAVIYPYSHPTNGGSFYFKLGSLNMLPFSSINADGKGYDGGKSGTYNPYGPGGGGDTWGGGGYGGLGGRNTTRGLTYGSSNAPVDPGSGGDGRNGYAGTRGGGLIRLDVAGGTATLNGTLTANGVSAGDSQACGSGGGIYVKADTVSGSGTCAANGGDNNSGVYGSGGGGRIALEGRSLQYSGSLSARGGTNTTPAYAGGTGTVVLTQTASINLKVQGSPARHGTSSPYDYGDNGVGLGPVTVSVNSPADEGNGTRYACIGWALSNMLGAVTSGVTTQAVFTIDTNQFLTWYWTNEFYLATSANSNGTLQADRTGWYTNGTPVTLQANPDSGFSFLQWSGNGVPTGQSTVNPLTVTMDRPRSLTAQFATLTPPSVRAWTGLGDWWSVTNWNPAGIPGRAETVAIVSGTATLVDPTAVTGVIVSNTGTLRVESTGTLTVASSMVITGASAVVVVTNALLTCSNDLTVAAGGRLYACGGTTDNPTNPACTITTLGTLLVRSNGYVFPFSHPTNGGSAFFRVGNLTVESGGWITASSNGYAGAFGLGVGGGRGGGGYGGGGGDGVPGSELGGGTYGWSNAPVQPGSGSGAGYGGSRPGGGVVWVEADRIVTVDGTIAANGSAADHDKGAGAGGSIYLRCSRFAGTGLCEARGGDTSGTSGGGGGGRIAVYRAFHAFTGSLSTNSVRGGTNSTYYPARSGQYGTLVLVNLATRGTVFMLK